MKTLTVIAVTLFIIVGAVLVVRLVGPEDTWICINNAWVKHGNPSSAMPTSGCGTATDYKNATYVIDGQSVTLVNGRAETTVATSSASHTVTQYFGNEATGDLNGDGVPDVAFLLTQNSGGSGTFYYVVVALKTASGYQGTNAILLGDRIAPQTTQIENGEVIVNYVDRAPGEPMTTAPSFGVSKYLLVAGATLVDKANTSGVRGTVSLGPTCPVERIPPDPACADKPYATAIAVYRTDSNIPFIMGNSDANGVFVFSLPPGSFTLKAAGGAMFPHCAAATAVVAPHTYANTNISCDTGIR